MADEQKFRELLAKYHHILRNLAARHVQPGRLDIEDLLQEFAIILYNELQEWEEHGRSGEIGTEGFSRLFYTKAHHRAIDLNRMNRPKVKPVSQAVGDEVFAVEVRRGLLPIDPLPTDVVTVVCISLIRSDELVTYTYEIDFKVLEGRTIEWVGDRPKHREVYVVEGVRKGIRHRNWSYGIRDIRAELGGFESDITDADPSGKASIYDKLADTTNMPDHVLIANERFKDFCVAVEQVDADAKLLLDEMLFPSSGPLLESMHVVGFPVKIKEPDPDQLNLKSSTKTPFYSGVFKVEIWARYFGWTKTYVVEKLEVLERVRKEIFK